LVLRVLNAFLYFGGAIKINKNMKYRFIIRRYYWCVMAMGGLMPMTVGTGRQWGRFCFAENRATIWSITFCGIKNDERENGS
jgi:hypothetical protein